MSIERPIVSNNPEISIVIPTLPKNDHSAVVECLSSQNSVELEVLVVNDSTLDICEARNEGIERAQADIVALTDDDCRPDSDWAASIRDAFDAHPDLICLEGKVTGGRTYEGYRRYVGCNLSFSRASALSVGGFRSEYAGWRDDTEFGWRMERDAKGTCAYAGSVEMYHPELPRANIHNQKEAMLKAEYPNRYDDIIVPDTLTGKLNDWLWRNGIWDTIDRIRYFGRTS